MKIAVVIPKGPSGERGGAENLYEGLVTSLNEIGHHAVLIEVLVDESSFESILEAYCQCYYLNLDNWDLVISTKAPTYMVRHRNHISYLLHPIRVFYDMFDVDCNPINEEKIKQQKIIHALDKFGLDPIRVKRHYVIGETVTKRMRDTDPFWEKISFEKIYPAPPIRHFLEPKPGEYIFLPGRLHRWKRIDLVIKAMIYVQNNIKLLIAGAGEDDSRLKNLVCELGLEDRVVFLGKVSESELLDLYSRAIVVPFPPIREDFGYITIEAFKSKKPVITCIDSGEPSKLVTNNFNGYIVDPDPLHISEKINYCIEHPDETAKLGENGYNSVRYINWEIAISHLLNGITVLPQKEVQKKINLLIVDMQPIEPAIGGGRLRLKGLYSNLGDSINALYIGTYDWHGEQYRELMVSETLKEIDIPLHCEHFRLNEQINKLLPGKTIIDTIFSLLVKASPDYVNQIVVEAINADVIVFSHPWLYPLIKTEVDLRNKFVIYDSQNCEAVLRKHLLGDNAFGECIANMVKYVEMELCEASHLILTCSELDKYQYKTIYHIDEGKIEVFPNGVNTCLIQPVRTQDKETFKKNLKLSKKVVIFIGSGYPPNIEAGKFVIDVLAEKCSDVQFLIIGSVGSFLQSDKRNVRICGTITDDEKLSYLSASDIAINPMFHGSGTNIKMFDFFAAGLPTISTPIGARGIIQDQSFIIVDITDFPKKIKEIFENPDLYNCLSMKCRLLVEKNYHWPDISKKLGMRIIDLYLHEGYL